MTLEVDIRKHFPSFTLDVQISAGAEVYGLLGASGCGKSLTMRSIAGIETPDEGRIVVNGQVFFDSEAHVNLRPQQRKTALLFQNYMLFPNLTVEQNVAAGIPRDTGKADRDAIVARELRRFDVEGMRKRYPAQLSGGQQQRVALARMLAADPGILMLDEPFSALDSHLKSVLEQNLGSLFDAFSGTIVYVSHDIDEAVRFCDRISVMESGHVMEVGTGRDLVDRPQSMAGLKLSGCKNVAEVERLDATHVRCRAWGITLEVPQGVPEDTRAVGIHAFAVEQADGSDEGAEAPNVFRARVDRVSDSRFQRALLIRFLDRDAEADPVVDSHDEEVRFLSQHMTWQLDMLTRDLDAMPSQGREVWVRIPPERLLLVGR